IPDYLNETPVKLNLLKRNFSNVQENSLLLKNNDKNKEEKIQKNIYQIPTCYNQKDKINTLELSKQNSRVTYKGQGKSDSDAASVRANFPIPNQCGIFYWETEIISKGRDGYIGIGFCTEKVNLQRLPGWDQNSWGYHGDDGHSFQCCGTGKNFGPTFTTGDIIGCGINFYEKCCFFTKNGVFLGIAFKNLDTSLKLFPTVGLRTPGEIVETNFGLKKFSFDINHCFGEEKFKIMQTINQDTKLDFDLNEVICSYLYHNGFVETAHQFFGDTQLEKKRLDLDVNMESDNSNLISRRAIIHYIIGGNMQAAEAEIEKEFPNLLNTNKYLRFQLQSLNFIEMVKISHREPMGPDGTFSKANNVNAFGDIIKFGRHLQENFGGDSIFEEALLEIFSLIAYNDPFTSPHSYLFEEYTREGVADAINRILLTASNNSPTSSVEELFKQLNVVLEEMVNSGIGAASFLNIEKEFIE
ncbi:Ran-binding protein 9, partial [Clydaea vesicula]